LEGWNVGLFFTLLRNPMIFEINALCIEKILIEVLYGEIVKIDPKNLYSNTEVIRF